MPTLTEKIEKKYYTPKEIARLKSCSPQNVLQIINYQNIPVNRKHWRVYVHVNDVKKFFKFKYEILRDLSATPI